MANRERGAVEIEALGRTLTLRFSFNAMCEIEEHFDKSFDDVMESLNGKSRRLTTLRGVLWGALGENEPRPSLDEIGTVIDDVGPAEIGEALGNAFQAAFPQPEEGKAKNPRKASKAGTGQTS